MWLFPKKHFEWREPLSFRREMAAAEAGTAAWWVRPAAFTVISALMMGTWALARLNLQKHPPALGIAVALALLMGWFAALFLPWLGRRLPSTVMVFRNRIFRTNGCAHREFKFEKIASFTVLAGNTFQVIALEQPNGRRAYIGMPTDVNAEAVCEFLEHHGVRREPTNQTLQWIGPALSVVVK
jgi:hypothetical protein